MNHTFLGKFTFAFVAAAVAALPLAAKPAPPFGDSLTWNTGKEAPNLAAMGGKSVLVVFFQSWCGICNGWSDGFFKQIGEAYGDDPLVVLVAIKTDGGGTAEALDYLKDRTDTSKWLVAADEGGTYYRQATGQDSLYHFMWVTPNGEIGESGKAGTFTANKKPMEFTLARKDSQVKFRKGAQPLMPAGSDVPGDLQPAVRFAEQGLFLSALAEAGKFASNAALKENVATLRQQISAKLDSAVKHHATAADDEANKDRYLSYKALQDIAANYGQSAPAIAARQAAAKHSSASWVSNEQAALAEYESIMRRAARADDERANARIDKALEKLAAEYPETTYGRMAAASAKK